MEILLIILGVFIIIGFIIWLGLRVQPAPFPPFPQSSQPSETIPLPQGLPAPVERMYRAIYGERIPVIHSAVFTGRVKLSPFFRIPLQGRFRFIHDVGKGYRHYIEATFFGRPLMKVNERYLDGQSLFELPFGPPTTGAKLSQAANIGMWAELFLLPSVFLTDPRVRWVAIDAESALLVVPFEQSEETFIIRFDGSDMIRFAEIMRYRDVNSAQKSLWITSTLSGAWKDGLPVNHSGSATWLEDGQPWAVFRTEDVRVNVDVHTVIRQKGL